MFRPLPVPEHVRGRSCAPKSLPAEQRQHTGLIDNTGRAHSRGRQHFQQRDHFVNVGVSSPLLNPLFIDGATFKNTRALPSTITLTPRRSRHATESPSRPVVTPHGKKHFDSPNSGNISAHLSPRPSEVNRSTTPCRGRAHVVPQPSSETRTRSPVTGKRIMGGPPVFVAPEFRPRPYSPQLGRVATKPSDSPDIVSFDPSPRSSTPIRTGKRLVAQNRNYDVITGQELFR